MPDPIDLESREVSRIALLGADYRNVGFELLVAEGDRVDTGAAVMRDARRPEIRFCAPRGGTIARIERGARRKLSSLQIDVDPAAGCVTADAPKSSESESLRQFMLASGVWSSLRTRPFGNIPDPQQVPAAIFINGFDCETFGSAAQSIVDAVAGEFDSAARALAGLGDAPVYLCHAPGRRLGVDSGNGIHCESFDGGASAALAGVHINRLCPIGFGGGEVWQIGYQDAVNFGHLLLHGSPWPQRIIALDGSAVESPRALLVAPGASIEELLSDQVADAPLRLLAGGEYCGRPPDSTSFLGAGQHQLSAIRLNSEAPVVEDSAQPGIVIPNDRLEALAPPGIFPVPLMRSLQLGDAERARQLGALELLEEDVVPLTRACVSGNDYSLLLRRVLEQLEAGR